MFNNKYVFDNENVLTFKKANIIVKNRQDKVYNVVNKPEILELYIPNNILNDDFLIFNEVNNESSNEFELTALLQQTITYSNNSVLSYHSSSNSRLPLAFSLVAYNEFDNATIDNIINFFLERTIHASLDNQDTNEFKAVTLSIKSNKEMLPAYLRKKVLTFYVETVQLAQSPLRLSKDGSILFRDLNITLLLIPNLNDNVSEQIVEKTS